MTAAKHARGVLVRFSYLNTYPVETPTDPSVKRLLDICPQHNAEHTEKEVIPYRVAVGSFKD
ncbi:Integrase core domain containing hypothetical protein [Phytophthora palmivora]|uniref:Uncharacterized protein n=1 Tax=Phytophthora palmivora TaxID=4796 RepID=A0A2P4WZX1_9STRA|nr:Integrase core domain containing hypothetical protein [Phytophthora palmivora]